MPTVALTYAEWLEEGKRRFGEDKLSWRFECPSCHGTQTPEQFRPFTNNPEVAMFNCIGRYTTGQSTPIFSGKSPCNYTSGGLFNVNPCEVFLPGDEKPVRVFAFAEVLRVPS